MADHSILKASDLAGDERIFVERRLGRAVGKDETISISAHKPRDEEEPDSMLSEAFDSLTESAAGFFANRSLQQLAAEQGIDSMRDISCLSGVFGPDENVDEFVEEIYAARK